MFPGMFASSVSKTSWSPSKETASKTSTVALEHLPETGPGGLGILKSIAPLSGG